MQPSMTALVRLSAPMISKKAKRMFGSIINDGIHNRLKTLNGFLTHNEFSISNFQLESHRGVNGLSLHAFDQPPRLPS